MLQKNSTLTQGQIDGILKTSALPLPPSGSRAIFDFDHPAVISCDADCGGTPCDAVGSGVIQADVALAMTPAP